MEVTLTNNVPSIAFEQNPFREVVTELLKDDKNINEIHALIYAHAHFAPSEHLFQAVVTLYEHSKPETEITDGMVKLDTSKIMNFLKNWIKLDKAKFKSDIHQLRKLLDEFIANLPNVWSTILKTTLDDQTDDDDEDGGQHESVLKFTKSRMHRTVSLLHFKPHEVAQQLTKIDQEYMRSVNLHELLGSKWTNEGEAPSLEKIVNHSNQFAYWVLYEMIIIKLKYRTKLVAQVLAICAELIKLQNFQSLMSIYLAFHIIPIEKLNLLEEVSSNINYSVAYKTWREVSDLLDYDANFKNYRDKLKTLTIPIVLSQEVLLKDLLFNEEVAPNFVNEKLNTTKLFTLGGILVNFSKCRNSIYEGLPEHPDLAKYLTSYPTVTRQIIDDLLDNKSELYRNMIKYRRGKIPYLLDFPTDSSGSLSNNSSMQDVTSSSFSESVSHSASTTSTTSHSHSSVSKSESSKNKLKKKFGSFGGSSKG